jgi:hypothetical protein
MVTWNILLVNLKYQQAEVNGNLGSGLRQAYDSGRVNTTMFTPIKGILYIRFEIQHLRHFNKKNSYHYSYHGRIWFPFC